MSRHHDPNVQRASRRALAPIVASGRAVCPKCGEPIRPGEPWQAGHVVDLALGGATAGPMLAEHRSCGSSAGAKLGNQLRARPRRRLGAWLRRELAVFECALGTHRSCPCVSSAPAFFWAAGPRTTPRVLLSLPRISRLWTESSVIHHATP